MIPNPRCTACGGTGRMTQDVRVVCPCVEQRFEQTLTVDLKQLRLLIDAHGLPATFEDAVIRCTPWTRNQR